MKELQVDLLNMLKAFLEKNIIVVEIIFLLIIDINKVRETKINSATNPIKIFIKY